MRTAEELLAKYPSLGGADDHVESSVPLEDAVWYSILILDQPCMATFPVFGEYECRGYSLCRLPNDEGYVGLRGQLKGGDPEGEMETPLQMPFFASHGALEPLAESLIYWVRNGLNPPQDKESHAL